IDRYTIPHAGLETPLFECLNGVFIETESQAAYDAQDVDRTISLYDGFENHRTLIAGLAGLFRILWLDSGQNRRRSYAAADPERTAAIAAAFAWTDTGTFTLANPAALTCTDAATDAGSCGGRSWNAIRIA